MFAQLRPVGAAVALAALLTAAQPQDLCQAVAETVSKPGDVGMSLAVLGDLDGDGTTECIAGLSDDPGGLWLLSITAPDGALGQQSKELPAEDVLPPGMSLSAEDRFGASAAYLGNDVLAIGAPGEDGDAGALYLFQILDPVPATFTVALLARIAGGEGGFTGVLAAGDGFGSAVAAVDDLDGDGFEDLVVGAPGCDDGGTGRGSVWVLFLDGAGTVIGQQKISATQGGSVPVEGSFGAAVCKLGTLLDPGATADDDVPDVAVGSPAYPGGGAVWNLTLHGDGTVKVEQRIGASAGGFGGALEPNAEFGASLCAMPPAPLNPSCEVMLFVGTPGAWDWALREGAVWALCLQSDGTVAAEFRLSSGQGGFAGFLKEDDRFGTACAPLMDLNGDGMCELLVGAPGTEAGATEGAVWVVFLGDPPKARIVPYGCGANFAILDVSPGDEAWLGQTVTFTLDVVPGAQLVSIASLLYVSSAPSPEAPCGTPGSYGELLVDISPGTGYSRLDGPWTGSPVLMPEVIPNDPVLIGRSIFVQGSIITPNGAALSNGLRLVLAPVPPE